MGLAPSQRAKPVSLKEKPPQSSFEQRPPPLTIDHPPNPRRAVVVGAVDAACWTMQRTLVHMLIRKELMTELVAQRETLGEEGAAHLRAWTRQLGCTDIPDPE